MTPFTRTVGALALAGGVVASVATLAVPSTSSTNWFSHFVRAAVAGDEEDAIVFYRDPMGGADLSKNPRNDSMGMHYAPVRRSDIAPLLANLPAAPSPTTEEPLFWRDPMGGTEISLVPKKDAMGMAFLPVRSTDIASLLPPLGAEPAQSEPTKAPAEPVQKRILYYRNPMGLPDISPAPKKDSMGMDYRPVYEGEDVDSSAIQLAPGKVQRTGVRTEPVQQQLVVSKIRVPGSIQLDERRITIVATRSDAFIDKVADVTTGDLVKKSQPLMRLYSPDIAAAAAQYLATIGFDGSRRRLENLAAPPELLAEIERSHKVPLVFDWPAPQDGVILERAAIDGMKAPAGTTLFKIADLSFIWALLDVSEHDYARIAAGQRVTIRPRGLPDKTFTGRIGMIYPQINKETRTVRVRVELANPDLILRPDMYVDAEIAADNGKEVITVPDSAVIDTGAEQIVILAKGDGRFEPRAVKIGKRGEGLVEIRDGVAESDRVVVTANFLIDAESNLKAALNGLGQPEERK